MHDNSSSPGPTHPAAVSVRLASGPRAEITWIGRYLDDLARTGPEMLRPFAAGRAAVVVLFVRQHEDDFARAGLPVDRRASLVVRSATLRDAVAIRNWDEVRATAVEIAMDLGAFISAGSTDCAPSTPAPPVSRTAKLLRQLRRYWGRLDDAVDPESAEASDSEPAEGGPAKSELVDGTDVAAKW